MATGGSPPPDPRHRLARPGRLSADAGRGRAMRLRALARGPPGGCVRRTREHRHQRPRRPVSEWVRGAPSGAGDGGRRGAGLCAGLPCAPVCASPSCARVFPCVCARGRGPEPEGGLAWGAGGSREPQGEGNSLNLLTQLPLRTLPGSGGRTGAGMDLQLQPLLLAEALALRMGCAGLMQVQGHITPPPFPSPSPQGLTPAEASL